MIELGQEKKERSATGSFRSGSLNTREEEGDTSLLEIRLAYEESSIRERGPQLPSASDGPPPS